MSRIATKAGDNIFYLARFHASSRNDRLGSREGAAEELGIDRSRLAKIELDLINPYPEEIKMMAREYHAPELENYFCREICPLGSNVPKAELVDLDRITVRTLAVFRNIDQTKKELLDVAADGKISTDEEAKMRNVLNELQKLEEVAQSLRLWVKKNIGEEV